MGSPLGPPSLSRRFSSFPFYYLAKSSLLQSTQRNTISSPRPTLFPEVVVDMTSRVLGEDDLKGSHASIPGDADSSFNEAGDMPELPNVSCRWNPMIW